MRNHKREKINPITKSKSVFPGKIWVISKHYLAGLIIMFLGGCVSQKEYNAVVAEKNRIEDQLATLKVNETLEDYDQIGQIYAKDQTVRQQQDELYSKSQKLDSLNALLDAQRNELNMTLAIINKLSKDDWYVDNLRGTVKIDLSANLLFPLNSDTISEEGIFIVSELASDIKSLTSVERIRVVGHSDNQQFDNETYDNWELSADRALTVAKLLQENGIDPTKLSAEGRGSYDPVKSNDTADGRASNRRVEIEIVPVVDLNKWLKVLISKGI